jgi:lincosamide and streptogramin A transport system ATP-binding/permease protein
LGQISIQNLTFSYDGSPENIFDNVSIQIDTSWKLGLVGRNGKGKTTLFRLLTGNYRYSGSITANVSFEYFPYAVSDESVSALEVSREIYPQISEWEFRRELNLLAFDTDNIYSSYHHLSYGEKTKVMLAALFCKPNAFLLIDEPTNHLDVIGRKVLASYLSRKDGFILVSHDRQVLDECVDHIISINRANIDVMQGNFSAWEQNKAYQDAFELAENEKLKKDIKRLEISSKRASDWSDKTEKSKKGAADKGFVGHKAAKMMSKSKNIEKRMNFALSDKQSLLKNVESVSQLKISPLTYHKQTLISANNLEIKYNGKTIFSPMTFSIENGCRAALCGKNGCGKSSLIKLILGENIEYSGVLEIGSSLKISYVSQGTEYLSGS